MERQAVHHLPINKNSLPLGIPLNDSSGEQDIVNILRLNSVLLSLGNRMGVELIFLVLNEMSDLLNGNGFIS